MKKVHEAALIWHSCDRPPNRVAIRTLPVICKHAPALRRVQTVSGTHYTAGDRIEYSSRWQADWVPASVESVNRDGTLNIKCSDGTVHNWVNSHKVRHMQ